jgi:hypothetical protein
VYALTLALALLAAPSLGSDANLTRQIVDTVLKVPTDAVDPRLVQPFLEVDPETQPKAKREKIRAKQLEFRTLLKLHDTKKKGNILSPAPGCAYEQGLRPTSDIPFYRIAGFGEIEEVERDELERRTLCTQDDMVCQFSLTIFHDKGSKKPRRLFLNGKDPLMAIIGEIRTTKSGQSKFFGLGGISCTK